MLALIATFDDPERRATAGRPPRARASGRCSARSPLILLAIVFLVRTVIPAGRGARAGHATAESEATHWPTPAALLGLLVAYVLLLDALGYALATTIFVWLTAWLLGSDRPVRDAVVGLGLGVIAGYAFSQWLNVQLPAGPWGV